MKNTLSISVQMSGIFQSEFTLTDGCSSWESHEGMLDSEILSKLIQQKTYTHLSGSWMLLLPADQKIFEDTDFAKTVQAALRYIYERDNPSTPDYFC